MQVSISGRHMEVTEALKDHIGGRLDKVTGHFDRVIDAEVVLSVEKHRHIAEITLHANGVRIHGKEASEDMYQSIDTVVDKIDRQILKFKDRNHRHHHRRGKPENLHEIDEQIARASEALEAAEERGATRNGTVVNESIDMKPMSIEEARLQLELSRDKFLAFSNADTSEVNVMYPKKDGSYGLIQPAY
jgi:putative sigma-54 modulation protein